MTAIPSTARTLTDLGTVAPADAALMLLRSGSTDGKTTIAALIDFILGPQLAASIGGAGTAQSYSLTDSAWTVIDFATTSTVLQLATTDGAGTVTADLDGAGPLYVEVSWSLNTVAPGSATIEATAYVDGAAVGSVHRAKLTNAGEAFSGGAIIEVADGDTVQVALRTASGSLSVDVDSLSLRVRYIPRITTP